MDKVIADVEALIAKCDALPPSEETADLRATAMGFLTRLRLLQTGAVVGDIERMQRDLFKAVYRLRDVVGEMMVVAEVHVFERSTGEDSR